MSIDLFSPIELGPYHLPNRVVMAPLTRSRAGDGNVPQALNALYYAQRASAGLIISEATQVVPEGQGYITTPGVHSDAQVDGWRLVTDAVHAANGRIFLQLWHVGRISHTDFQPGRRPPVAPSAVVAKGKTYTSAGFVDLSTPRALETDEIAGVVAGFRTGARRSIEAGFDGVEIHAANGYLIDQFLRDRTNQRTDRYGGSIENRLRFLVEIVDAVAAEVGADKVGIRISPENTFNDIDDSDPQALFTAVVRAIAGRGLAYLHVVEGDMAGADAPHRVDYRGLKADFHGCYIANFGYDKTRGNQAIAEGRADMIAFGKPFLANPDLVTRYRLDAPLNAPDDKTFYGGGAHGYTDYPLLADVG